MLADLLATPGVRELSDFRGPAGALALHGGLEEGTARMATVAAAAAAASHYAVIQPDDLRWHIPSVKIDPRQSARLRTFLEHVRVVVSFHGFGRKGLEGSVLVGGGNRRLAGVLVAALRARTDLKIIDDLDEIPPGLRGLHPRNPVNLPEFGGVQLEISPQAREPEPADAIAVTVGAVLAAEQRSLCVDEAC